MISANDLANYSGGLFSTKLIDQIMQYGRIPAFATREEQDGPLRLNYLDYICKSTITLRLLLIGSN